ncbi:MAG: sigma-70 family RNA polymerase sigma factor [Muribaculaceae bacterium]|nr:sigma-70 family RNA polymerase sigma factor [Muribaculaceae bacterium]
MGMSERERWFEHLYLTWAPRLLKFNRRFVDEFAAEDIVQESFLELYQRNLYNQPERDVVRLVFTISRNKCIDLLRHQACVNDFKTRTYAEQSLRELMEDNTETLNDQDQKLNQILHIARELPERRREIFDMYYVQGLNSLKISQLLKLSKRTVENNIYRALVFIRAKFFR